MSDKAWPMAVACMSNVSLEYEILELAKRNEQILHDQCWGNAEYGLAIWNFLTVTVPQEVQCPYLCRLLDDLKTKYLGREAESFIHLSQARDIILCCAQQDQGQEEGTSNLGDFLLPERLKNLCCLVQKLQRPQSQEDLEQDLLMLELNIHDLAILLRKNALHIMKADISLLPPLDYDELSTLSKTLLTTLFQVQQQENFNPEVKSKISEIYDAITNAFIQCGLFMTCSLPPVINLEKSARNLKVEARHLLAGLAEAAPLNIKIQHANCNIVNLQELKELVADPSSDRIVDFITNKNHHGLNPSSQQQSLDCIQFDAEQVINGIKNGPRGTDVCTYYRFLMFTVVISYGEQGPRQMLWTFSGPFLLIKGPYQCQRGFGNLLLFKFQAEAEVNGWSCEHPDYIDIDKLAFVLNQLAFTELKAPWPHTDLLKDWLLRDECFVREGRGEKVIIKQGSFIKPDSDEKRGFIWFNSLITFLKQEHHLKVAFQKGCIFLRLTKRAARDILKRSEGTCILRPSETKLRTLTMSFFERRDTEDMIIKHVQIDDISEKGLQKTFRRLNISNVINFLGHKKRLQDVFNLPEMTNSDIDVTDLRGLYN